MDCIHSNHFWPKPMESMMVRMAWCWILSKDFSKSILMITISFFEWWHKWKYSKDQAMQSCIVLSLIKPYWFLCTKEVMTSCNLLAKSLVTSFTDKFSKEMGLKSLTLEALSTFRMRVMNEELMLLRQILLLKKSLQMLWKSCLIIGQHFLMKSLLNPFGPGHLSLGNALIISSIYFWVEGLSSWSKKSLASKKI